MKERQGLLQNLEKVSYNNVSFVKILMSRQICNSIFTVVVGRKTGDINRGYWKIGNLDVWLPDIILWMAGQNKCGSDICKGWVNQTTPFTW